MAVPPSLLVYPAVVFETWRIDGAADWISSQE
jgi:hypothetical protein